MTPRAATAAPVVEQQAPADHGCPRCSVPLGDGERVLYGGHARCMRRRRTDRPRSLTAGTR